jgi:hypothetical protein
MTRASRLTLVTANDKLPALFGSREYRGCRWRVDASDCPTQTVNRPPVANLVGEERHVALSDGIAAHCSVDASPSGAVDGMLLSKNAIAEYIMTGGGGAIFYASYTLDHSPWLKQR